MSDAQFMRLALDLASKGTGRVSPNPRVGCVIVNGNEIVAQGWHEKYGERHAETIALSNLTCSTENCTMYVTLEPCSHQDKQPPCTEAIIASGIRNVVVGMVDPYPKVAGSGVRALQEHGINVTVGVEEEACQWLNRFFTHHVTLGTSYIAAKIASTIDGRSRPLKQDQRWITSEQSRTVVHELRTQYDAVLVGINTVVMDDPTLNVRHVDGRDPIRIVVDSDCKIPLSSQLVSTAHIVRTILLCSSEHAIGQNADTLRGAGLEVLGVPQSDNGIDLQQAALLLGQLGISSVLCEPGPSLLNSLISAGVISELHIHMAPSVYGCGPLWFKESMPVDFTLNSAEAVGPDAHLLYTRKVGS